MRIFWIANRWRRAPSIPLDKGGEETLAVGTLPWRPTLSDYQCCFGEKMAIDWHALDLIVEEYRIRWVWGDRPTPASLTARYPEQAPLLARQIASVDALLKEPRAHLKEPQEDPDSKPPAQLSMDAICEGDRVDDFQIIKELGKGAFARVFLAQQLSMQRLVAEHEALSTSEAALEREVDLLRHQVHEIEAARLRLAQLVNRP